MKGFIDELKRLNQHFKEDTSQTEADRKFREMYLYYKGVLGRKALYKTGRAEARVVVIEQVTPSYIRLTYKYYGMGYSGAISTCTNYGSLICGDDRLELT